MKQIYLIRHAQSESNAGLAIRPNAEIEITRQGKQQAKDVADWLFNERIQPVQVFVSEYVRTQQTAEPYLQCIEQRAQVLEDLFEFNYLDFQRIAQFNREELWQEAEQYWYKNDIHYQDGNETDSFASFVQRVKNVRQFFDALDDGVYVVFTHGMWIGMLIWQLLHLSDDKILNMQNFGCFELMIRPKNCEVFLLNYSSNHMIPSIVKVREDNNYSDNIGEAKHYIQNKSY